MSQRYRGIVINLTTDSVVSITASAEGGKKTLMQECEV